MPELKNVTRSYTNDDSKEIELSGFDIQQFPEASEHEFYQSGSYLMCECHPNTAKRIPDGLELVKEKGGFAFRKREIS